jgi:hypothetical protein
VLDGMRLDFRTDPLHVLLRDPGLCVSRTGYRASACVSH